MPVYPLPDDLRRMLKRPLGRLIRNPDVDHGTLSSNLDSNALTVAVGDATTERLLSLGFVLDVEIVDGREMRMARSLPDSKYRQVIRVSNPAGCLTDDAFRVVSEALQSEKPVRILVDGEEDLLALPVLALYPVGTVVIYGQPKSGLVISRVDEDLRATVLSLLRRMGVSSLGRVW